MLNFKVPSAPGSLVKKLAHHIHIIRVNPGDHLLQGQFVQSIKLKNSMSLLLPEDLAVGEAPSKAACVTEALCLRQKDIRVAKFRVKTGILERGCGLGC
jgi:hypothetical protein